MSPAGATEEAGGRAGCDGSLEPELEKTGGLRVGVAGEEQSAAMKSEGVTWGQGRGDAPPSPSAPSPSWRYPHGPVYGVAP
jgi:hypothetical protein